MGPLLLRSLLIFLNRGVIVLNNIKIEEIIRLIKKKKHKRNPLLLKWLIDLMIEKHYFIENPSILKIYYSSRSIAHIQVMSLKWKTNNTDILKLQDSVGNTVAHYQARYTKWTTNDKNILCLENNKGWTVAHELAKRGNWVTDDEEILSLKDHDGWSVAHELAAHGYQTEKISILSIVNCDGTTVAHIQARCSDWQTDNVNILCWENNSGWSVAHEIALQRYRDKFQGIVKLKKENKVDLTLKIIKKAKKIRGG